MLNFSVSNKYFQESFFERLYSYLIVTFIQLLDKKYGFYSMVTID